MKCAVLAVLILAAGLPVAAQRVSGVAAHIPFSFEVADRVLPAGDYRLTYAAPSPGVVQIEDANLQHGAYVLSGLMSPDVKTLGGTFLSFNRYEDRYFLARVVFQDRNCAVMKSKSERELVTSKVVKTATARPAEVKITASVR